MLAMREKGVIHNIKSRIEIVYLKSDVGLIFASSFPTLSLP